MKAYKATIDELTDDYNATLGYIENLKAVPKGEEPKDFSGGVNDDEATTEPAKEADEVPTVPNAPEFNGGANPADAPAAEVSPEFNGGVNAVEAAVNEVPEFKGGVSDGDAPTQPTNPEFNGGVNDTTPPTEPNKPDGDAPKPPKTEASVEKAKGPKDEIKRLESEIAKLESDLKDAENNGAEDYFKEGLQKALDNTKQELKEILVAWLNNVTEVPELEVTRYVDSDSHDISDAVVGKLKVKDIEGYEFVNTTYKDGITTHIYKVKLHEAQTQPAPDSIQGGARQQGATPTEGQAASPAVGQKAKPTSKEGRILPNTGVNSSSTAALGLSLIALVGVAVRRKLSK